MKTTAIKTFSLAMVFAFVLQIIPSSSVQAAPVIPGLSEILSGSFWAGEPHGPTVEEILPEPEPEPTVQEVLTAVCEDNGYGEDCAKTLLGMLWTESSNRSTVIGDSGRARGYYQIHYRLHNISTDCAEDLICSSQWTIDYLERNHYPTYVNYAVQCHNSCNAGNGYVGKVVRYGNYFWDQPLEIKQAAPVTATRTIKSI